MTAAMRSDQPHVLVVAVAMLREWISVALWK
jgi:hypothetical protein